MRSFNVVPGTFAAIVFARWRRSCGFRSGAVLVEGDRNCLHHLDHGVPDRTVLAAHDVPSRIADLRDVLEDVRHHRRQELLGGVRIAATTSEKFPSMASGTENETDAEDSSGSRWITSPDAIVLIDFAMTSTFSRWIWPRIGSLARATASTASEKNSRVARSYHRGRGTDLASSLRTGCRGLGVEPLHASAYLAASDASIVVQRMPSDSSTAGRTPSDAAGDSQTSAPSTCAAAAASMFSRLSCA